MRTASFRFSSVLMLMFHTCYFPSLSWWIVLQPHKDVDWTPSNTICGKTLIWIQDEEDGKCLGTNGFGECGDVNLWQIWGSEGAYILEHYVGEDDGIHSQCLVEIGQFLGILNPRIVLEQCSKKKGASWNFSFSQGKLSNNASPGRCLYRLGNKATSQPCRKGFTSLVPVLLSENLYSEVSVTTH